MRKKEGVSSINKNLVISIKRFFIMFSLFALLLISLSVSSVLAATPALNTTQTPSPFITDADNFYYVNSTQNASLTFWFNVTFNDTIVSEYGGPGGPSDLNLTEINVTCGSLGDSNQVKTASLVSNTSNSARYNVTCTAASSALNDPFTMKTVNVILIYFQPLAPPGIVLFNVTTPAQIILYNFTLPSMPPGLPTRFGPLTTDLSTVTNFSSVNYKIEIQGNGSDPVFGAGQPGGWANFSTIALYNFTSLNMTSSTIGQQLQALAPPGGINVQINLSTAGVNSIFLNDTALTALNSSAVLTLYHQPFRSMPNITTDGTGTALNMNYVYGGVLGSGNLTFTVDHFSTYNINDQIPPKITFNPAITNGASTSSTTLLINATFNGTSSSIANNSILINVLNSTGSAIASYVKNNMTCTSQNDDEILICNITHTFAQIGGYNITVFVSDLGAGNGNNVTEWRYRTITSSSAVVTPSTNISSDSSGTSEWRMFGRTLDHNRYYPGSVNMSSFSMLWNFTTGGAVDSSPAVVNGILYIGSDDFNLYALNATNGSKIWNYTTGAKIGYSSPAVADGIVYVGSNDFAIYAFNTTNGSKIWNYTTGGVIHPSPIVANGILYIGSDDDKTYAFDAANGSLIWSYTTQGDVDSSAAVVNGIVYFGSDDDKIYALNATTGAQIWNYTAADDVEASPAISGGAVYISTGAGVGTGIIFSLNASTGIQIWNYTIPQIDIGFGLANSSIHSSCAVANGIIYVGTGYSDGKFYALNASTGIQIWNYTTNDIFYSSPTVANGLVFIGADGILGLPDFYVFNSTNGSLVSSLTNLSIDPLDPIIQSSPIIVNGIVYIGSSKGNRTYAFGAATTTTSDTTPPSFTHQVPIAVTVEYGTAFSYDVNASDANTIYYWVNDTTRFAMAVTTGILTNNTALNLGLYTVNITVNDTSNNRNSTLMNITVRDTTAPTWDQTPSNQLVEYGASFSYDVNATDLLLANYSINDTTNFAITNNGIITNKTALNLGAYMLNISVNDTSGNRNSAVISVTVQDTAKPLFGVIANQMINYSQALGYQITATDNVGVTNFTVNDTNFRINSSGYLRNNTLLAVGTYGLLITATDASSNTNTTTLTVRVDLAISPTNVTANTSTNVDLSPASSNLTLYLANNVTTTIMVAKETPSSAPTSYTALKGVNITVDSSTSGNLTWAYLKIYYNATELTAANIDEATLKMYFYNTTAAAWQLEPNQGVDTTNDYVWANITHFSLFGLFGTAPTTTNATTSGGGGGGGGTYEYNAVALIDEKRIPKMNPGYQIQFFLGNQKHTIEAVSFQQGVSAKFKINSEPFYITVNKGETKEIDVNKDGTADLSLTLNDAGSYYADATFTLLGVKKAVTPAVPIPPVAPTPNITSEQKKEEAPEAAQPPAPELPPTPEVKPPAAETKVSGIGNEVIIAVALLIAAAIIVGIYFVLIKKK